MLIETGNEIGIGYRCRPLYCLYSHRTV